MLGVDAKNLQISTFAIVFCNILCNSPPCYFDSTTPLIRSQTIFHMLVICSLFPKTLSEFFSFTFDLKVTVDMYLVNREMQIN